MNYNEKRYKEILCCWIMLLNLPSSGTSSAATTSTTSVTVSTAAEWSTVTTCASVESGALSHLLELRVDNLFGLHENGHQVFGLRTVGRCEKCVGCSGAISSSSSANSVDVIFWVVQVSVLSGALRKRRQSGGCCGWREGKWLRCWCARSSWGSPRQDDRPLSARWRTTSSIDDQVGSVRWFYGFVVRIPCRAF